jgi:hypothetical protein
VSACRDIEQTRCRAALQCELIDDVAACERYYRDQCLHGLPTSEVPEGVEDCVASIQVAGECAAENGSDAPPSACDSDDARALTSASGREVDSVCKLVQKPESLRSCRFLNTSGAAGAAGAGSD